MAKGFNLGMNVEELAPLGLQMLKSKKVSPEEVQMALTASENPEETKAGLSQLAAQNPEAAQTFMQKIDGFKTGKGKQKKESQTTKEETSDKMTRTHYQDADQFSSRANDFENLDFMKDQKQGIQDSEDFLNMQLAQKAPKNSDYWVKPLLSLADAQNGTNMSRNFTPSETSSERMARLMKMKEGIQDQKAGYSKQLLEGLSKMKDGTDQNSTMNQLSQQLAMTQGMLAGGGALGAYDDRRADMAHRAVVQRIKMDPTLNKITPVKNRIENAVNNAAGVDAITPEQFHELQQAIRGSIATGSSTGAERGSTYYSSLGLKANEIEQFLSGKPKNLKLSNPFVQHVLQIANLELGNLKTQAAARGKVLSKGFDSIYDARPDLKADRDALVGTSEESYNSNVVPAGIPKKKGAAPARTKSLNDMTNEELDAYEASLKGK